MAPEPFAAVELVVAAGHEGGVGISEDGREQEDNDFDRIFAAAGGVAEEEDVRVGKIANGEDDPKSVEKILMEVADDRDRGSRSRSDDWGRTWFNAASQMSSPCRASKKPFFNGPENRGKRLEMFRTIAITPSFSPRRRTLGNSLRLFSALLLNIQTRWSNGPETSSRRPRLASS
jgi:hypothetical protein